jgi:lipopolysaccharide/colanic/teichoic acid biosynthesis glycosyltransferase
LQIRQSIRSLSLFLTLDSTSRGSQVDTQLYSSFNGTQIPLPAYLGNTTQPIPAQNAHTTFQRIEEAASKWCLSLTRRIFDLAVALTVLILFSIPMLLVALAVRLTSNGPALFKQQRVGRGGRLFWIYKFRSMETIRHGSAGPGLTRDGDTRITPLGRWLRKLKLDELPQFINILRGEMSLVGPRPKLPQYEALQNMPYRPGITGAATLAFRNEEEILRSIHPEHLDSYYAQHIQPLKAHLDARYMCAATLRSDLSLIANTFIACIAPERVPTVMRPEAVTLHPLAPFQNERNKQTQAMEFAN